MPALRSLLASFFLLNAAAFGADPGLLSLVMPDAKVIAGIQVDQARISPFGQYVLTHMQPDDENFKKFMSDTGFDPRRDLREIVMASNSGTDITSHWVVIARGMFDASKFAAAVKQNDGTVTSFQGVDLLSGGAPSAGGTDSVVAFPDNSTAVMGDPDSVKTTIQRFQTKASGANLATQVKNLSASYDFWFLTLVPLSEFAAIMPDPNMGQAMKGNLFQAISQASGGLKFGANVQFQMQAVARSEQDAKSLADVVRFIAGLIQTNKGKGPAAGQVSTLVDSMHLSTSGNVMTMSLSVPETQVEQLLMSAHPKKQTASK